MTDVNLHAPGVEKSELTTLKVAELQALAAQLGIQGANKLRKGELVDAISEVQNQSDGEGAADAVATTAPVEPETTEPALAASQVLIEPLIAEPTTSPALDVARDAPTAPRKRAPRRATSADALGGVSAGSHVNSGATGVESLIPAVDALLDRAQAAAALRDSAEAASGDQAATQEGARAEGGQRNNRRGQRSGAERGQGDQQRAAV